MCKKCDRKYINMVCTPIIFLQGGVVWTKFSSDATGEGGPLWSLFSKCEKTVWNMFIYFLSHCVTGGMGGGGWWLSSEARKKGPEMIHLPECLPRQLPDGIEILFFLLLKTIFVQIFIFLFRYSEISICCPEISLSI